MRVVGRLALLEADEGGRALLVERERFVPLASRPALGAPGDLLGGSLRLAEPGANSEREEESFEPLFLLEDPELLAAHAPGPGFVDADLPARLPVLEARARVVAAVRAYFDARGFLEVETPARVVCPGLEPHLVALPAGEGRWLATSPELHLKRLLVAGASRVYELARAFRGDERGPHHALEFTMLEWYRAHEGLDAIVDDVAGLVRAAARAADLEPPLVRGCDLAAPPERRRVRELFIERTGIDLARASGRDALADAARGIGTRIDEADDWDEIFFRVFLERIEPTLGRERLTVLEDWPASQAALARVEHDGAWPVARRFEVYAAGIELANAFDELTDPAEQRRRHEVDRRARIAAKREAPSLDEAFLGALEAGHPPASGIALGLDRLVALVLGLSGAREAIAFPE